MSQLTRTDKNRMEAFGYASYEYDRAIDALVEAMDDQELEMLRRAFNKLSSTNCWYAVYDARPRVLEAINRAEFARRAAREATQEALS